MKTKKENNRKKRYYSFLLMAFSVIMLSACGKGTDDGDEKRPSVPSLSEESPQSIESTDESIEDNTQETPESSPKEGVEPSTEETAGSKEETGGTQMQELVIEIDGQRFPASLYDNETTQALMERFPMTLDMEELHGNEKFYYLDEGLPANSENVGSILTGDIMLFGSDCLVLFYDDFATSYSYTRIGHIEDEEAFVNALSGGTVEVTFKAGE